MGRAGVAWKRRCLGSVGGMGAGGRGGVGVSSTSGIKRSRRARLCLDAIGGGEYRGGRGMGGERCDLNSCGLNFGWQGWWV